MVLMLLGVFFLTTTLFRLAGEPKFTESLS